MRESIVERGVMLRLVPETKEQAHGPAPLPGTLQLVDARLEATPAVANRIMRAIQNGSEAFVLSSSDGRLRARVKLAAIEAPTTEHTIGSSRIIVDWSRGTVENGDRRTSLSRTELRLLAALFEGNGRTHTRRELIDRVWASDQSDEGDRENALAVYICSLRKRLGAVGAASVLQTVRGVGYRVTL